MNLATEPDLLKSFARSPNFFTKSSYCDPITLDTFDPQPSTHTDRSSDEATGQPTN